MVLIHKRLVVKNHLVNQKKKETRHTIHTWGGGRDAKFVPVSRMVVPMVVTWRWRWRASVEDGGAYGCDVALAAVHRCRGSSSSGIIVPVLAKISRVREK
jgi:hypothetical protein